MLKDYNSWLQCLKTNQPEPLERSFFLERLEVYSDLSHVDTKKYIAGYGKDALDRLLSFYKQALSSEYSN